MIKFYNKITLENPKNIHEKFYMYKD